MTYNKTKILVAILVAGVMALALSPAWAAGPVQMKLGARAAYIGSQTKSGTEDYSSKLDITAAFSPVLRVEYPINDSWSLEAGVKYDIFRSVLKNSTSKGGSVNSATTFDLGPIYRMDKLTGSDLTPFMKLGFGVKIPNINLAAPVKNYASGAVVEGAVGIAAANWEVRLGYSWAEFRPGDTTEGATFMENLFLPEYFIEGVYKFNL